MRINFKITGFCILILLLTACGQREDFKEVSLTKHDSGPVGSKSIEPNRILRFGFDLRLSPKEDVRIYLPFLHYLESQVGRKFSIRFTRGYEDTAENLGKGITQFAAIGPVNAIIAHDKFGAGYLAMGLNPKNLPEYRAVIFTRADSDIHNLADLKGGSFIFGNRLSTQGHILPRKMLEDAGLTVGNFDSYSFSGSHEETIRLVMNGSYEAGGMQDTLAYKLAAEGKIRIIAKSAPAPSSLICFSPDVDPKVVRKVKQALLTFDPTGRDAGRLYHWARTEMPNGFVAPPENAFQEIRRLMLRYRLLKP